MATATRRKTATVDPHLLFDLLDRQGSWTEKEYLDLTDHTNRLVEFVDGFLEILPMPTDQHQSILGFLFVTFNAFVTSVGGKVHFSPLRLRVGKRKFREPDLLLLLSANDPRRQNRFWTGADLVLEVVSEDNPKRDLIDKRGEYAAAGAPEYWIVDPATETILVLGLNKKRYRRLGKYGRGALARSSVLAGFQISVDEVFDAT